MALLQSNEFQIILAACSLIGGISGITSIYEFLQKRPSLISSLIFLLSILVSIGHGLGFSFGLLGQFDLLFFVASLGISFTAQFFPGMILTLCRERILLACTCAFVCLSLILFCIAFSYLAAFYIYPGAGLSNPGPGFWFAFSSITITTLFSIVLATVSAKKDFYFR